MSYFITKFMSNTLSTMTTLQKQWHESNNLCSCCGTVSEIIQYLYQCNHEISHGTYKASVDSLWKWLKTQNTDPNITTIFVDALLYISGEGNELPQCPNVDIYSEIPHIGCLSIILSFISKSLTCTQQKYSSHIGIKRTGLKWASQIIIKI